MALNGMKSCNRFVGCMTLFCYVELSLCRINSSALGVLLLMCYLLLSLSLSLTHTHQHQDNHILNVLEGVAMLARDKAFTEEELGSLQSILVKLVSHFEDLEDLFGLVCPS